MKSPASNAPGTLTEAEIRAHRADELTAARIAMEAEIAAAEHQEREARAAYALVSEAADRRKIAARGEYSRISAIVMDERYRMRTDFVYDPAVGIPTFPKPASGKEPARAS